MEIKWKKNNSFLFHPHHSNLHHGICEIKIMFMKRKISMLIRTLYYDMSTYYSLYINSNFGHLLATQPKSHSRISLFFYICCWQMKFIKFSIICSSSNTYLIFFQYSHAASIHNFVFVFKTDIFVSYLINCIFVFNQFFNYCKNILLQ